MNCYIFILVLLAPISAAYNLPAPTVDQTMVGKDCHKFCCYWAANGECDANPLYMRTKCQKSCGTYACTPANYLSCQVKLDLTGCPYNIQSRIPYQSRPEDNLCKDGSTPIRVDPTGNAVYDMVFVLDESGSTGSSDFEREKDFLRIFVKKFGIIEGFSQTGLVKFSSSAQSEWDFGTFPNQNTNNVIANIDAMSWGGGGTDIDSGLTLAKSIIDRHRRPQVIQAVLLLTDGEDSSAADVTAQQMRQSGVQIFVIGIGDSISPHQLSAIAGGGKVFRTDIQDLPSIATEVADQIRAHGRKKRNACF